MAKTRPKTQRPDRGEAREALIRAATEEFANAGFRGASVSAIAKRANVTQPLINHHFSSKEGLWRAVLDDVFSDLGSELVVTVGSAGSTEEKLIGGIRMLVGFFARRPELARIIATEVAHPSESFEYLQDTYIDPVVQILYALVGSARKEKLLDCDPRLLRFVVIGAVTQPFTEVAVVRHTLDRDPFSASFVEEYSDLVVQIFQGWIDNNKRR